jgi:hypothetical protein
VSDHERSIVGSRRDLTGGLASLAGSGAWDETWYAACGRPARARRCASERASVREWSERQTNEKQNLVLLSRYTREVSRRGGETSVNTERSAAGREARACCTLPGESERRGAWARHGAGGRRRAPRRRRAPSRDPASRARVRFLSPVHLYSDHICGDPPVVTWPAYAFSRLAISR